MTGVCIPRRLYSVSDSKEGSGHSLFQDADSVFPGGTEETHETPRSGKPALNPESNSGSSKNGAEAVTKI